MCIDANAIRVGQNFLIFKGCTKKNFGLPTNWRDKWGSLDSKSMEYRQ